MKKKVKDVVKVLKDSKGKGVYDQSKIILEDELPSSILLHDGWIYLSGRGTVRRFKQKDPGGEYNIKEVIAQGFCGYHHQQVSGMTIGNDGWLYITSGDDDNYVEGSDGSRATVLRTGAVFRCRPDGSRLETFARGFHNPYRDAAFDAEGNMFHADNDSEINGKFTGCRLMHIAEDCDFGWRLRQGAHRSQADLLRTALHGESPGKMPPLLKTGRGAPAGLLIYNDTRFPENYRGLLYYPDVVRKLIRALQGRAARSDVRRDGGIRLPQKRRPAVSAMPDGAWTRWSHVYRGLAHRLGRGRPSVGRRRAWPHLSSFVGGNEGPSGPAAAADR